jgi:hypothetical protein
MVVDTNYPLQSTPRKVDEVLQLVVLQRCGNEELRTEILLGHVWRQTRIMSAIVRRLITEEFDDVTLCIFHRTLVRSFSDAYTKRHKGKLQENHKTSWGCFLILCDKSTSDAKAAKL